MCCKLVCFLWIQAIDIQACHACTPSEKRTISTCIKSIHKCSKMTFPNVNEAHRSVLYIHPTSFIVKKCNTVWMNGSNLYNYLCTGNSNIIMEAFF